LKRLYIDEKSLNSKFSEWFKMNLSILEKNNPGFDLCIGYYE